MLIRILARLIEIKVVVSVFDRRNAQASAVELRDKLDDERRLACSAPPGKANRAHGRNPLLRSPRQALCRRAFGFWRGRRRRDDREMTAACPVAPLNSFPRRDRLRLVRPTDAPRKKRPDRRPHRLDGAIERRQNARLAAQDWMFDQIPGEPGANEGRRQSHQREPPPAPRPREEMHDGLLDREVKQVELHTRGRRTGSPADFLRPSQTVR